MAILAVDTIGISFGGIRAVDGVTFAVKPGEIFSIIGPNGAGKTTLFNLISGVYRTDSGSITLAGQNVTGKTPSQLARCGLSRTFQNLQIFSRMTVLENVMTARHLREHQGLASHLLRLPGARRQEAATRETAMDYLDRVGLGDHADQLAGAMSYGAMKRLEIARALATEPRVLLLDEPAAGCNANETDEIDRLLLRIARDGTTVVLIEHDMKLVMGISDRILVLDQGRVLVEGPPKEIAADARVITAYLGHAADALTGSANAGAVHA